MEYTQGAHQEDLIEMQRNINAHPQELMDVHQMSPQIDGWKKKTFLLILILFKFSMVTFSLYILTPLWFILLEGECKEYSLTATCLFSHYVCSCLHGLFLLCTTTHMNVPNYLILHHHLCIWCFIT